MMKKHPITSQEQVKVNVVKMENSVKLVKKESPLHFLLVLNLMPADLICRLVT